MKLLKRLLLAVVALAVLGILVIALFLWTLDPNDYKGEVVAAVEKNTGRSFALEGNVELSLYPWVGVKADGVRLGNAPGFGEEPLVAAGSLEVRAKLLPLLGRRVEMDTIRIVDARLNLVRNAEGRGNWEGMGAPAGTAAAPAEPAAPTDGSGPPAIAALAIGGVDVRNARVSFRDEATGQAIELASLTVTTGALTYGDPVALTASGTLSSTAPDLAGPVSASGTLAYDLDAGRFTLRPFSAEADLAGPALPGGKGKLALGLAADYAGDLGTARIEDLRFEGLGTTLAAGLEASGIDGGRPRVQTRFEATGSDLAAVFRALGQEALAGQLAKLGDRGFSARGSADANLGNGAVSVPEFDAKLLGATVSGRIEATDADGSDPGLAGTLTAQGPDLATLLRVLGQFEAARPGVLRPLGEALAAAKDRSFDVGLDFTAAPSRGALALGRLDARLPGAEVHGALDASGLGGGKPAVKGRLEAKGGDLPLLVAAAGALDGARDSALDGFAAGLADARQRSFSFDAEFDADQATQRISLPRFSVVALGATLGGTLATRDGRLEGRLEGTGSELGDLLGALGQGALAEVLQKVQLTLPIAGNAERFSIAPLALTATVAGRALPGGPVEIALGGEVEAAPAAMDVAVRGLSLRGLGLDVRGEFTGRALAGAGRSIDAKLEVAPFDLRRLAVALNQKLPAMADAKALTQVEARATVEGRGERIAVRGLEVGLDGSRLTGEVTIASLRGPDLAFDLAVDALDTTRYLPPRPEGKAAAPVTPEVAAAGAATLPLDLLRGIALDGRLAVGQLVLSGLRLADVTLTVKGRDGRIVAEPIGAALYDGRYDGRVTLDARGPQATIGIDSTLAGIQADPLLTDLQGRSRLRGRGDLKLALTTSGADTQALTRNLDGTIRLDFRDGSIKGINLGKLLRTLESGLSGAAESESTDFTELGLTVVCRQGVCGNDDLLMKSPLLRLGGKGTLVDLRTSAIDYVVQATVVDSGAGQGGPELEQLEGIAIPVKVSGTTQAPKFAPDFGGIVRQAAKKEVQKQLGKVLGLGGGETAPAADPTAPATDPAAPTAPAADPAQPPPSLEDRAKDAVKEKLKDLLKF